MIDVRDNADAHRYEASEEGMLVGFEIYDDDGSVRRLVHTETVPGFEGRGVGGALARGALDDIRDRGLTVTTECEFMASYIERHPDYADLVAG